MNEKILAFSNDIKKAFWKGAVTLIGWSVPLMIAGLLLHTVKDLTIDNRLRINDLNFEITNNMAVSPDDNPSRYHEIRNGYHTFSYSFDTFIKGHGKIDSAWIVYGYEDNNEIIPVKIEIKNTIFRILTVSPSKIHFQITYLTKEDEIKGHKRAYLILRDDKTKTNQIYLLIISNQNGEIRWYSEDEFLSIAPMDQHIEDPSDDKTVIAYDRDRINTEMEAILSYFNK